MAELILWKNNFDKFQHHNLIELFCFHKLLNERFATISRFRAIAGITMAELLLLWTLDVKKMPANHSQL